MKTPYDCFKDFDPEVLERSMCAMEPRFPCLLLLDASGSMQEHMPLLLTAVNRFAADVCKDEIAARIVDVAVVSFNSEPTVVQDWCPITEMRPVELTADGGTDLDAALRMANDKVRSWCRLPVVQEIGVRVPYIILITDGYGGDVSAIAKVLRQRSEEGKVQLWVLCVPGYDKKTVAELTANERVLQMGNNDFDFIHFFDTMNLLMKTVSCSAPGEEISIPPEENPLNRPDCTLHVPDLSDWLNKSAKV